MKCERAQEFFSDYCEGRLTGANLVALEAHIADCATCREQIADLKRVWQMLAVTTEVDPPADLRAQVWRRIDAAQPVATAKPSWNVRRLLAPRFLAAATAALALIVLGTVVVPGNRSVGGFRLPFGIGRETSIPVEIGAVKVASQPDAKLLTLPVTATGTTAVNVTARVESWPEVTATAIAAPDRFEKLVLRLPGNAQGPIAIRLQWTCGSRHGTEVVRTTVRP